MTGHAVAIEHGSKDGGAGWRLLGAGDGGHDRQGHADRETPHRARPPSRRLRRGEGIHGYLMAPWL